MTPPIEGRRLRLRRFDADDVPALLRLASDEGFHSAVDEFEATEASVRAYVAKKDRYRDFEPGKVFDLAVETVADGAVVGIVTLVRRPPDQGEVGYALHAGARGRGLATEAAGLLIDHAFTVLGLHRVTIKTRSTNPESAAVARRLGLRLEGTLVEAADMADPRADLLLFGLLRREWAVR